MSKVVIERYLTSGATPHPYVQFWISNGTVFTEEVSIDLNGNNFDTGDLRSITRDAILAFTNDPSGYNLGLTEADILNLPTVGTTFAQAQATRSIVTGTGATGFQISATKAAFVNYSITISTAVQIGLATNVDGYVVLEICPTNSATAGNWVEIGRTPQAQNIALAIALSSTQKGGGQVGGFVPAGYYAKLRSMNTAGTPTYTYNSGQEVLVG